MLLTDTHCHIHDPEFATKLPASPDEMITAAQQMGVDRLICVGTDLESSRQAVEFAANRSNVYATAALHPHEAGSLREDALWDDFDKLRDFVDKNLANFVAIGECGLDYFYNTDKKVRMKQRELLIAHLEMAQKYHLPLIFHVREAFDDFWSIFDQFKGLHGVIHSFSATTTELDEVLRRGLYVGLNGIMTFTRVDEQLEAAKAVPLDRLVLETDAPFLTPVPFRGKMCEPKYVRTVAEFLADLRGESLEKLAKMTYQNSLQLFGLKD